MAPKSSFAYSARRGQRCLFMPVVFIFALSLHRCGNGRGEKDQSMVDTGGWWEKKKVEITEPSGVGCGPGCRLAGFGVSRSALFEQEFSRKLDGTWARVQFIYFSFFLYKLPQHVDNYDAHFLGNFQRSGRFCFSPNIPKQSQTLHARLLNAFCSSKEEDTFLKV